MLAVDLHDVPIDTLQSDSTEVESNCSGIFLFEHGLFGKPVSTFPDHAPNLTRAKPAPPPHRASSKAPDRALPERSSTRYRARAPIQQAMARAPSGSPWPAARPGPCPCRRSPSAPG